MDFAKVEGQLSFVASQRLMELANVKASVLEDVTTTGCHKPTLP